MTQHPLHLAESILTVLLAHRKVLTTVVRTSLRMRGPTKDAVEVVMLYRKVRA